MDDCSKDVINGLPDNLLCQILSNLSTKEAALTSLLSKRWRYLFALVPNLDFDDLSSLHPEIMMQDQTSFIDFVDRVLKLRGKDHVNKLSLKCGDGIEDEDVFPWISNVLRHGVSDLSLHVSPSLVDWLPSKIFTSKTLVKLEIGGPRVKLRNVCLPRLKTLNLDSVVFEEGEIGFAKLISGCPVLEELGLAYLSWWDFWDSCSVSSKILRRLTLSCPDYNKNPKSVSFDSPNVVYLKYSDTIAHKYPRVSFDSLVEASISIRMTKDQRDNVRNASDVDEETKTEMVSNAAVFLMGICNVKTLYLSYETLETLNFCYEAIPVFNSLTHLTVDSSNPEVGWESLPDLLKNCPNLETLVFQGLHHKATERCGDVCLCQGLEKCPSSLSQCPVKFLTILKFGEAYDEGDDLNMEMEMEKIKHFLKKMPNLEKLIIYYNTSVENDLSEVSSQLQMLSEVASLKCKIQVISDNLSLSPSFPISLSMKYGLSL
uniref:F-box/LRR-repeat protein n=1 Tax=Noccaea caerulescens TaxID=107243 RepID=A0A1J3HPM3_NOCCA